MSLTIVSAGRSDIVLSIPTNGNPKGLWFTLKEGSRYHLRFSIKVSNDIVCGLKYTNTVWKTGIKGLLASSCTILIDHYIYCLYCIIFKITLLKVTVDCNERTSISYYWYCNLTNTNMFNQKLNGMHSSQLETDDGDL